MQKEMKENELKYQMKDKDIKHYQDIASDLLSKA